MCGMFNPLKRLFLRIARLHQLLGEHGRGGGRDMKRDVKKDAWLLKGMAVLVKRKHARALRSRSQAFNRLLSLLQDRVYAKHTTAVQWQYVQV